MKNIMIILAFIASFVACTSGGEVVVNHDASVTSPVTSAGVSGSGGSGGASVVLGSSGSAGDSSLTSH